VYMACARWYKSIKLEKKCEENDHEENFRV
jgi:peptide/histidine transporter 3/4